METIFNYDRQSLESMVLLDGKGTAWSTVEHCFDKTFGSPWPTAVSVIMDDDFIYDVKLAYDFMSIQHSKCERGKTSYVFLENEYIKGIELVYCSYQATDYMIMNLTLETNKRSISLHESKFQPEIAHRRRYHLKDGFALFAIDGRYCEEGQNISGLTLYSAQVQFNEKPWRLVSHDHDGLTFYSLQAMEDNGFGERAHEVSFQVRVPQKAELLYGYLTTDVLHDFPDGIEVEVKDQEGNRMESISEEERCISLNGQSIYLVCSNPKPGMLTVTVRSGGKCGYVLDFIACRQEVEQENLGNYYAYLKDILFHQNPRDYIGQLMKKVIVEEDKKLLAEAITIVVSDALAALVFDLYLALRPNDSNLVTKIEVRANKWLVQSLINDSWSMIEHGYPYVEKICKELEDMQTLVEKCLYASAIEERSRCYQELKNKISGSEWSFSGKYDNTNEENWKRRHYLEWIKGVCMPYCTECFFGIIETASGTNAWEAKLPINLFDQYPVHVEWGNGEVGNYNPHNETMYISQSNLINKSFYENLKNTPWELLYSQGEQRDQLLITGIHEFTHYLTCMWMKYRQEDEKNKGTTGFSYDFYQWLVEGLAQGISGYYHFSNSENAVDILATKEGAAREGKEWIPNTINYAQSFMRVSKLYYKKPNVLRQLFWGDVLAVDTVQLQDYNGEKTDKARKEYFLNEFGIDLNHKYNPMLAERINELNQEKHLSSDPYSLKILLLNKIAVNNSHSNLYIPQIITESKKIDKFTVTIGNGNTKRNLAVEWPDYGENEAKLRLVGSNGKCYPLFIDTISFQGLNKYQSLTPENEESIKITLTGSIDFIIFQKKKWAKILEMVKA